MDGMIAHIHLQHPYGLAGLLLLPWLLWPVRRQRTLQAVVHPAARWMAQAFSGSTLPGLRLLPALVAVAWMLGCIALAEPQWVNGKVTVSRHGRDIMLVVDLSGSMVIRDFSLAGRHINRLQAVKHVLSPFIAERTTDRIGMVVFGEDAYIQAPLTYDHELLRRLLLQARLGMVGERTAIGAAIALAVKHLHQAAVVRKAGGGQVIVLLTDGRNNAGTITPMYATGLARALGIRIYTVGVGSRTLEAHSPVGKSVRYVQYSGSLNESELKAISATTGGAYFRAGDTAALARIAAQIDRLESVTDKHTVYFASVELYPGFILAGLVCFIVAWYRGRGTAALP